MKAFFASVPEQVLEWRRRRDADQWDEMWDGVLHAAPSPNLEHQSFEFKLAMWLEQNWAAPNGCRVYPRINVANPACAKWTDDYRIPDIVLLTPRRFAIDKNEYFDGGPDAVVEIRGPDDETYDKLDFYFMVGVLEVWVIERDSKEPEIFERIDAGYRLRKPDADGWRRCEVAGAEFRAAADAKLEIRLAGRTSAAMLP